MPWRLILAALVGVSACLGSLAWAAGGRSTGESPASEETTAEETDSSESAATTVTSSELDECWPRRRSAWYVEADGLVLRRQASENQPVAAFRQRTWKETLNPKYEKDVTPESEKYIWVSTDSTATALTLNDTQFARFQGGGQILLGRALGEDRALEVSYFDLADWSGTAVKRDATLFVADVDKYTGTPTTTYPASLFSPFSNFGNTPLVGLDYNSLAQISYSSSLNNLELNLRRWVLKIPECAQASLLIGGRYMNVDESLYYHTESGAPSPGGAVTSITTDTGNSLLGVQIGGQYEIWLDPNWSFDCGVKGGLFNNSAHQGTVFLHRDAETYQGRHAERADEDAISSAIDARFTLAWMVSPRMTIRGGYQLLYVTGLALASNNFSTDANVLTSGPATIDTGGSVLYHGLHLGLTWMW